MANSTLVSEPRDCSWPPAPAPIAAAGQGAELREAERAIKHWNMKAAQFGSPPPLVAFDLSQILEGDWAYRFLIVAGSVVETHAFLVYGERVSSLLELPKTPAPQIPMMQQLPERYRKLFAQSCGDAIAAAAPVRRDGMVRPPDGRYEVYRAAFMPVGMRPYSPTQLVFGAFNCRRIRSMDRPPGSPD